MMAISSKSLRCYPLFDVLNEDELEEIQLLIRSRMIRKNEILMLESEDSSSLYFVENGWFKAEKTNQEGRQQTIRFIGPQEMINELSVFSNAKNSVTVIAMEDARIFSLTQDDIEKILDKYPKISRGVIKSLANRIQHLLTHIENLSLYAVEARLARLILAEAIDGIWERQSWKTQAEIAAQLGTVLDVVNRNLQKLEKKGAILINREQISIKNKAILEEIASG